MQNNLKIIEKEIEKNRLNAAAARKQADAERIKANMYDTDARLGDQAYHQQQAINLDQNADALEAEADALEPKKMETLKRINDLTKERETLNQQTVDRINAIDKELSELQGGLTI